MKRKAQAPDGRHAFRYSAVESYFAVGFSLIGMVVLSRLLTPAQVGTYVVGFAIASLVQSLRDFGTSSYLLQTEASDTAIRATFGVAAATSAAAGLLIFAGSSPMARFYDNEGLLDVLRLCALLAVLQPIGLPARAILRRNLDFKTLCWVNTTANGAGLVTSISFAALGAGHISAPLGALAGSCASIILLSLHSPKYVFVRPSFETWRSVVAFGGYATGASLLADVGMSAPAYVVGRVLGFADVALYNRAQSLLRVVLQLIVSPLLPAVLPTLSSAKRDGRDVNAVYLHLTSMYLVLAWPAFGLLALAAEDVVRVALGEQWTSAAPIAQALCIGLMIWSPTALSGDLLTATGHIRSAFIRELMIQPARVALVYAASHGGLVYVALSQIAVHGGSIVITQAILRRKLGVGWQQVAAATWRSGCVFAVTLALPLILVLAGLKTDNALANMVAIATIGSSSWLTAVFLLRHPAAQEVLAVGVSVVALCRASSRARVRL